jgi:hypothetical protein
VIDAGHSAFLRLTEAMTALPCFRSPLRGNGSTMSRRTVTHAFTFGAAATAYGGSSPVTTRMLPPAVAAQPSLLPLALAASMLLPY